MLFTQQWIHRRRSHLQAEIRALHQVDAGIKTSYHVINAGDESSYNIRIGLSFGDPFDIRTRTRCDRLRPCSTCSNRGLSSKCAYPVKSRVAYIHGSPTCPRDDLKGRLAALEEQIVCLLEISHLPSGSNATAASTDDTSEAEHRTPTHRLHNTLRTTSVETGYVSYFHWTSILNNIIELKDEIQQQSGDVPSKFSSSPPRVSASPQLLYGCAPTSMENLLATIPERKVADNLVAAYFKDLDISNGEESFV